ncbi:MAG: hypothetical protein A2086_03635 [Spirochaetes bacterium GWD1_27_9]|nr:MAG: hypothetical protein A2Z98_10340 [Spirochaetes bacterium GWB1_27_13]OHD25453.1 MAG: hypothetical protein A2Y34_17710 [Spirochaetes bacterium GWC1_27_15]OHD44382.1 MAG: hypothetical protein A2086_03635 [Spirochaetes bacterium GWD1_27_9]
MFFFSKKNVKINISDVLMNTLKEAAHLQNMSVSEYINYLVYKENFFHLSSMSLQKEEHLEKFYKKYCNEKQEKDLWSNIFNLENF